MASLRIAVVGAGPAGASAAAHLARRGHRVVLVDRAAFPRDKTCGDWLTPAALAELRALGLDEVALEAAAPGHARPVRTALVSPDGRRSERPLAGRGACVPRRLLDARLREQALAAGAEPRQAEVREPAGDERLHDCALVLDARGSHAAVADAIGLRSYLTVPRAALAAADAERVALHTDGRYRRGYGWLFPVQAQGDALCFNVGVGLWRADSARGHSVADFFAHFLDTHATARALRDAAAHATRPVGHPVALARWRPAPVAGPRCLRIGDAAGLADPLTGDGIGNALISGRQVAELIDALPDPAQAAAAWQRRCAALFGPEFRRALALRTLLGRAATKNLAARFIEQAAPVFGTRLHAALFGAGHYARLLG